MDPARRRSGVLKDPPALALLAYDAESLSSASFCLCGFRFSVPGWCVGFERGEKAYRDFRDLIYGSRECVFVGY